MSSIGTRLNPSAPEFYPNKLHTLQPQNHSYYYNNNYYYYHTCSPPTKLYFYPTVNKQYPFYPREGCDSKVIHKDPSVELRSRGRFVWRRKGVHQDDERSRKNHDRERRRRGQKQNYIRAFRNHHHNNGGGFPLLPIRRDGDATTVMIRNIPSKYTREMLVKFLENHCMVENAKDIENGEEATFAFDFVYLPVDFRMELNKGYGFVNFTKPKAAWKFFLTAANKKWDLFLSDKIRDVVAARLQGMEELKNHFEKMNFPSASEEVLPLCFSPPRDGVIKGNQKTLGRLLFKPSTPPL